MWILFALENIRFALHILIAVTFIGIAWLYFDAWMAKKSIPESLKAIGFALIAFSFLTSAVKIEGSFSTLALTNSFLPIYISSIARLVGYCVLILGLILDPFPQSIYTQAFVLPLALMLISLGLPIFSVFIGLLYLYRSTQGKENHLKPIALGFMVLAVYDLISYRYLLSQTDNITIYNFVKSYSIIWIMQNLVLTSALVILGRWIWYYLLKRLQTQLYAIYVVSIVVVFLFVTVCFTGLLLAHVESQSLSTLEGNARMLLYALDSKKSEAIAQADLIAENSEVQDAMKSGSKTKLLNIVSAMPEIKNQQFLLIVNAQGLAVVRNDIREGSQDFFSGDPLIRRALSGDKQASIVVTDGVVGPDVMVRGAAPIMQNNEMLGVAVIGINIDNAFLDSVKQVTNYDFAAYGGNVLSATTLDSSGGHSRPVGVRLEDKIITDRVLKDQKTYKGAVNLFNVPFLASYVPLADIDGNSVGMVALLLPQLSVLQTAGESMEFTFLITTIILIVSGIPAYFIARHLTDQLK